MQNRVAKYILFFFFVVFVANTVTKIIEKKNNSEITYMQSEDDNSDMDESEKKSDYKKFQYNPNILTFDDDICHEFHFSNYYVHIKQIKYKASVPSLLDAIVTDLYSPPKV